MTKKYLLLLLAAVLLAITGRAQNKCATMTMYELYKQQRPEIAQYEEQLTQEYHDALKMLNLRKFARTTGNADSIIYDIPVVVHIIHNYGPEYLPDDSIYHMIAEMNRTYSLNYDTSAVIRPFKKYVGKANIQFHLATKDPVGNPTKGITRHYTYLTYGGDDEAKFDLWAPDNYYNIWIENKIGAGVAGGEVLAYANFPSAAASYPFNDGVIAGYQFVNPNPYGPLTIEHETGHYFNLLHPWNNNGLGDGACGTYCGDDDVDDTPPTVGHCSTCNLYDTACATGYAIIYPSSLPGIDSLEDYPDTTNVQNIMDYATCPLMFTKLQTVRMRSALNSSIGHRNNLWTNFNLSVTGVKDSATNTFIPSPDLSPIADFSMNNHFVCANTGTVNFANRSWDDTIIDAKWTFSNGATPPSSTSLNVVSSVKFSQPGWVTVTLAATGNNTGTTTLVDSQKLFVASPDATSATGYYQEFNPGGDLGQWPIFNYYNNNFKWKFLTTTGYYDNTCIEYTGYDDRLFPDNVTGSPTGDMDDLFTPAFDLTGLNGTANPVSLNFMYSGATRTGVSENMADTLEIDYNVNCGSLWTPITQLTKGQIDNQGSIAAAFTPQWMGAWALQSIALPAAAVTSHTIFRFRYKPGGNSTGNNFYMDRINFSNDPLGLNTLLPGADNIAIAPNPTNAGTSVIIATPGNTTAVIQVTDITGKMVYSIQQHLTDKISRIDIPRAALPATGMYLIHVSAGNINHTEKLVVY